MSKSISLSALASLASLSLFLLILILLTTQFAFAGEIVGTAKRMGVRDQKDVVVFIEKIEKVGEDRFEPPNQQPILDQLELTFIPHVLPILAGTAIKFPNSDKVRHNVFSKSKPKPFNLGTYPAGTSKSLTFDKAGLVVCLCNVHKEMSAFVLTLKNPYFAVTDESGNFSIPNQKAMKAAHVEKYNTLPAGVYRLKAWHRNAIPEVKEVSVPETGKVQVDFQLRYSAKRSELYDEQ